MVELWAAQEPETARLAPLIGAYLICSATGFLRSRGRLERFAVDLEAHAGLGHALGAIAFFVGAGIVSFHRHWSSLPEIVVSVTGCWWAFEGVGLLASPASVTARLARPQGRRIAMTMNLLALPVGAYLLAVGLLAQLR